ncbi:protein AlgM [Alcanivorax hongdengensis A-11-3]|uniref:Protein AlgM n=1 Tax=Alcanivorax hongdengensis A-11-3 TaxID=1177179 RepID=L0WAG6_9GAMM|nr:SoxR reducing system RseC family protein [Alcanivorax hongdengensis]EKF73941.1 protein AlgM [Alcanivorax hongdengensis A-11-3]
MIEEQGVVVAVEAEAVWVETLRASTCGACQARAGCGHRLINEQQSGQRARLRVPVPARHTYQVGDGVRLGLPEKALMHGALLVYGLPLLLLFIGALLGSSVPVTRFDASAVGGIAGLLTGFGINRFLSRRPAYSSSFQPRVLAVLHHNNCQNVTIRSAP